MFTKILQKMLKLGLILQVKLMKDQLGGKITIKFVGLRTKSYSYLIADGNQDKKSKGTKKCVIKIKPEFESYKNCLEATHFVNKINYLEKNKINIDSFFCYKRKQKKFIKNNKLILKTQQRFKNERLNVFTEEINKIALSSNDDKRIQSIDLIETLIWNKKRSSK